MDFDSIVFFAYPGVDLGPMLAVIKTSPKVTPESNRTALNKSASQVCQTDACGRLGNQADEDTRQNSGTFQASKEAWLKQSHDKAKLRAVEKLERCEIRGTTWVTYTDTIDIFKLHEFKEHLKLLEEILPRVAFIFCTCSYKHALKNKLLVAESESSLRKRFSDADRLTMEYAEANKNAFVVSYDIPREPSNVSCNLNEFLDLRISEGKGLGSAFKSCRGTKNEDFGKPLQPGFRKPLDIVVLAVVRNEIKLLPRFIAHYRGLGCNRFVIVDTQSSDGTTEYLTKRTDVTLYSASPRAYISSRCGRLWLNALSRIHAENCWVVVADADEFLVWPNCETEGLADLLARADRMGLNRIYTPLIDAYGDAPTCEMPADDGQAKLTEICSWVDPPSAYKAIWHGGKLYLHGGPRGRYAAPHSLGPVMSKQSVFRVSENGPLLVGSHFDNFGTPSPLVAPFLHFKFLPDFKERNDLYIAEGTHWDNSAECRNYNKQELAKKLMKIDSSIRLESSVSIGPHVRALSEIIRGAGLCGTAHHKKLYPSPPHGNLDELKLIQGNVSLNSRS